MGVAGGMIGCYVMTRDPFWMMSGALVGVISSAPGPLAPWTAMRDLFPVPKQTFREWWRSRDERSGSGD